MSNHFPTPPASFNLASLVYQPTISGFDASFAGLDFTGINNPPGDQGNADSFTDGGSVQLFAIPFNLSTPGDAGSFDQDSAESTIAGALDDIAGGLAALNGSTLASVQANITVNRQWTWQDSASEFTLTYSDTMTYPAS